MKNQIKINKKILSYILIIILIGLIFIYGIIIKGKIEKRQFTNDNIKIYDNNIDHIFKIDKILLCSSANAIDLSKKQNLQNLRVYQYTDIAVYINNGENLTTKNTVKKLYIDSIILEGTNDVGIKSLNYKNMSKFGLKEEIIEPKESNDIDFNIIHTNAEDDKANYDDATFFTDCSNPITLEYLNYDLAQGYKIEEDKAVKFDGSILRDAGITKNTMECKVRFRINIINNNNEKYSCPVNLKIPLSDIYDGTTMKSKTIKGNDSIFFRES